MARSYNRTDYGKLPLFQGKFTDQQLKKIVNNIAATANARIKTIRQADSEVEMMSDMAEVYNRLLKKHPEYFTPSGNIKRSLGAATIQQLETFIDEVAQIVLKPTIKETENKIKQEGLSTNKIKHLIKVHGRDKVAEVIGEAAVKKSEKRPSDEDEQIDYHEVFDEDGDLLPDPQYDEPIGPVPENRLTGNDNPQYDQPIGPRTLEQLTKEELIDVIRNMNRH